MGEGRALGRVGALLSILAAAPGCGYTLGHRAPPGVRTVSVPVFENATFPLRREIEFEISSAFRQEIQARTGLRIVDEASSPDMLVRGRILEFRERVIAEGRRDVKTESNVVSVVEIRIEDYLAGTLRVERVGDVEPFSIETGESFETGRRRAIRNIAEKLVVAMEDWGEGEKEPAGEDPVRPASAGGRPEEAGAEGSAPEGRAGDTIQPRQGMDAVGSQPSRERT